MSLLNSYATLNDLKEWLRAGSTDLAADTKDDAVLERILAATSRYIDRKAGRLFYPLVDTRYFDAPSGTVNDRVLWLEDDLLVATTVGNPHGTTLAATEYNLYPISGYPKYSIRIKQMSDDYWEPDSSGNTEGVTSVLGIWGYRKQYSVRAWATGSTLNESGGAALSASDLTWTMADGTPFEAGQILKIEDEFAIVASVSTNDVTVVARGENGSTAATHAHATAVTIWQVEDDIKHACLEIAVAAHKRRYGVNVSGVATITGAGVVITPSDIPSGALELIKQHQRLC